MAMETNEKCIETNNLYQYVEFQYIYILDYSPMEGNFIVIYHAILLLKIQRKLE